ncbi:succinate dehydrogenase assembly factor 2 [Acinetobacter sp. MD2]|uniref:FAD assembly factor SdhE n=1 Tax=Acinetobacter sp. MD2 TaxID=2600066 RepID=UPI002D1F5F74|nr:succinate dehydrogenase assembly factor 2 [Acinetobacter sp. MD2]MEB3767120.1 succinate dehydrogenase assembly factor 2 [Acinetobacter sp. MD2]
MSETEQLTLEERKVIYRARRGLKEIDIYFDPYVKNNYLSANAAEKALFAELVEQEDPDLLDWFMEVGESPREELKQLIQKLKDDVYQSAHI